MAEAPKISGVQYYEFDFHALTSTVADKVQEIGEQIYDEADSRNDEEFRAQQLGELIIGANVELGVQGYLGREVLISSRARMDDLTRELILDSEQELVIASGVTGSSAIEVSKNIRGIYEGITVLQEPFEDPEIECDRLEVCHKILVFNQVIDTPFMEQVTRLHAYLPLRDAPMEFFGTAVSYLPNERWLKSVVNKALYGESNELDYIDLEIAFQTILDAHRSKVSQQKNIDWFFDHLNEVTNLMGKELALTANGFLIQSGSTSMYIWGMAKVQGVILGFESMPTYRLRNTDTGDIIEEFPEELQLAICLEIERDGQKCLAKIPLAYCP